MIRRQQMQHKRNFPASYARRLLQPEKILQSRSGPGRLTRLVLNPEAASRRKLQTSRRHFVESSSSPWRKSLLQRPDQAAGTGGRSQLLKTFESHAQGCERGFDVRLAERRERRMLRCELYAGEKSIDLIGVRKSRDAGLAGALPQ